MFCPMEILRYIILDEFDGKPLRAFSNKASALHDQGEQLNNIWQHKCQQG